jgi:peptidyl-prolyl cis-trans isomerase A (cyclophilin A)
MRSRLSILLAAGFIAAGCGTKSTEVTSEKAPDTFKVKFETSKGNFVVEVHRDWAPLGADRFYELVQSRFFDDARFFRVLKGFVVQFGLNKDPAVSAKWRTMRLVDDPVKQSNGRGTITYAMGGPNSRTSQMFVNLADNRRLDADGFAPFGSVVEGMEVVDALYGDYGEGAPNGAGPDQQSIQARGNSYLIEQFPKLDYIKTAMIAK